MCVCVECVHVHIQCHVIIKTRETTKQHTQLHIICNCLRVHFYTAAYMLNSGVKSVGQWLIRHKFKEF